jgi:hypothetical protein
MASSSLTPYKDDTNQVTFNLSTQGENFCQYLVSGRAIATPYLLEIRRKTTSPGAASNDHVVVRVARIERNSNTGKPVTGQVMVDISIPKDSDTITVAYMEEMLGIVSSALNDDAALAASNANAAALLAGSDL